MTPQQRLLVAGTACVSIGTLKRYLEGRKVQASGAARIATALRELGFAAHVRPDAPNQAPNA
jgi:hypothetical protein